jgi:hypothetical protein
MFEIERIPKGSENKFTVSTPNGYITIAGNDEFVIRMVRDICQNSEEFINEMRETLRGETRESVAIKMRQAGFPENLVQDFEDGIIWDDLIDA